MVYNQSSMEFGKQNFEQPLPKRVKKKKTFERFVQAYGTPISILLGAAIIGAAIYFQTNSQVISSENSPNPRRPTAGGIVNVSEDDDPSLGPASAPVTMIEFGDFQCPFCRKFWREALPKIKEKYIDTGKVRYIYRDFPLSNHPAAKPAAEAAECAKEQNKFWEMHDKIFEEQDKQGLGTVAFGEGELTKWAVEIGLKLQEFENCLAQNRYSPEVQKDLTDGLSSGVDATPYFFVNGKPVRGALPSDAFEKLIEEALAK